MADEKVYTSLSSMKSAAATNKSPKKHQKHNSRGTANGHHQNGSGANRSASTTTGGNKRDVWPLTSTKQNNRAEYSSSEDLATCSKGKWHFYAQNTSKHTFNSVRSLFYLRAIWPLYGCANVRPLLHISHSRQRSTWVAKFRCDVNALRTPKHLECDVGRVWEIVFSFLWIYYTFLIGQMAIFKCSVVNEIK